MATEKHDEWRYKMTSSIHNCHLLAQWLEEKFENGEFTEEQIKKEVEELFGYASDKSKQEYLERALRFGQIQQVESGNFIATPKAILTPRQKLAMLRGRVKE